LTVSCSLPPYNIYVYIIGVTAAAHAGIPDGRAGNLDTKT